MENYHKFVIVNGLIIQSWMNGGEDAAFMRSIVFILWNYWCLVNDLFGAQLSSFNSFEGVLYCRPHYDQLLKQTGSLNKSFEGKTELPIILIHPLHQPLLPILNPVSCVNILITGAPKISKQDKPVAENEVFYFPETKLPASSFILFFFWNIFLWNRMETKSRVCLLAPRTNAWDVAKLCIRLRRFFN